MRKTLALAAATVLTFGLAACGGDDQNLPQQSAQDITAPISDDEFIQGLVDTGWPDPRDSPDLMRDFLQAEQGNAEKTCTDIRAGVASGVLDPNRSASDNGDYLEELALVHSRSSNNTTIEQKRAELQMAVKYRCPDLNKMLQYYISYGATQHTDPAPAPTGIEHARPSTFQWDVNGSYDVGPLASGGHTLPAGTYRMSPIPGKGEAVHIACSTIRCRVGGISTVKRATASTIITINSEPAYVRFRDARLEPLDWETSTTSGLPSTAAPAPQTTQNTAGNGSGYPTNGTIRVGYEAGMIPPGTYEVRIGDKPLVPMAQWVRCSKITCTQDNVIDFGIVQESGDVGYLEIDGSEVAIKVVDAVLTPYNG